MPIKFDKQKKAFVVGSNDPKFYQHIAAFLALAYATFIAFEYWLAGGRVDSIGYERHEREEIEE